MDDADNKINEISQGVLNCMETVAAAAASDLESMPIDIRNSMASFNNFTSVDIVNSYANRQTETMRALDALTR